MTAEEVISRLRHQASQKYMIKSIVKRYIDSIDEIINIQELIKRFNDILDRDKGKEVIEEIVLQSRVEFNVDTEDNDLLAFDETTDS